MSLVRFLTAQEDTYVSALRELRAGWKQGHWMWFIFPQLAGLGHSSTARFYAIQSIDEAAAWRPRGGRGWRWSFDNVSRLLSEVSSTNSVFSTAAMHPFLDAVSRHRLMSFCKSGRLFDAERLFAEKGGLPG